MSTDDIVFEAGRGASCVGLGEDILSFYTRNEASVARDSLVANLMGGTHEPGLAHFTLIANH